MGLRTIFHILLALGAVIAAGQVLGRLFSRIHQPPVIGEVIAGILLGPSLLGRVSPEAYAFILPSSIVPDLNLVAQFGVVVYLFLVGLELNLDHVRARARTSIAISQASIAAPFVLGSCLALYLYPRLSTTAVPFTTFTLFMGIAMSITAFPVLARGDASEKGSALLPRRTRGTRGTRRISHQDVSLCVLGVLCG